MEEAVIARSAALQTANAIYCKREASRKQSYRRRDASSGSRVTVSVSFQKRTTVTLGLLSFMDYLLNN